MGNFESLTGLRQDTMGLLISGFLLILNVRLSFAATKGFFGNPNQVAVVIQGRDTDARRLFETLNVPSEETPSSFTKSLTFVSSTNEKTLNLICSKAKNVENFDSCSLEVFRSRWSKIDVSSFLLAFDNQNSIALSHLFSVPETLGLVFQSADKRLSIRFDEANSGKFFSISYR